MPGIFFEGGIYGYVEISASGEPKLRVQFTTEARIGVQNKSGDWGGYLEREIDPKDLQFYGEGKVAAEIGPKIDGSLTAMKVMSAGVEGKAGLYADGSVLLPNLTNVCFKADAGVFGSGSAYIKAFPTLKSLLDNLTDKKKPIKYRLEEYLKFVDYKDSKWKKDTCTIAKELIPDPKEAVLKPGEEKDISLVLKLLDNGTTKEDMLKLGGDESKFLSVKSKQNDVVEAKVTKGGKIKLIAKEMPAQQNTEVEVTYNDKKKNRKQTIIIPVRITDFNTSSLDQFTGYWRDENNKKLFAKIDKKGTNNIEFQMFDYVSIWYRGDVQFNAFKQNALSGKAKHLGGGEMDAPNEELKKIRDFTLEKVSENKIRVRSGDSVNNLKRSSKEEFEKEQAAIYEGLSTPDTQPNQKPDAQSNQIKKVDGTYEGTATQSDPNVKTEATFKQIDDKTATIVSSQWALNSEGVTTKYRGEIQTTAVKQNDSTWTFTWKDNNDSKGTGTITFQGENATLDLIGDVSNPLDMGTISTKTQLKKKS
ncbi:hypothetical protein [Bacillus luti]